MTSVNVGTVDVYVINDSGPTWRVLVLQRGLDTRCPTSWETVHGHIESGEQPEQAAVREVFEETGLGVDRLYVITVQPFFLRKTSAVELAVVFAAFVSSEAVTLGREHTAAEWMDVDAASARFVWPRERAALTEIAQLLASGDAGPVEDVLRIF